jgi:beta-aspartyl-peptidase (threonine type)
VYYGWKIHLFLNTLYYDIMKRVILIHGGAGRIRDGLKKERLISLKKAVSAGYKILVEKDDPVDAVVEAVAYMEDSGLFNAGRGSIISFNGSVEMDASVMDCMGRYGAVGGVPNVRTPVRLACYIMRNIPHRLIVGSDAKNLAYKLGFGEYSIDELTGIKRAEKYLERVGSSESYYSKLFRLGKNIFGDTVGAVALNTRGELAAAVSTGGLMFKFPGRVGDSSILGAGIMVDPLSAAVATGIGEYIIDTLLTYKVVSFRRYMSLEAACRKAINIITKRYGNDNAGLICIDRYGNIGCMHNTAHMMRAYMFDGLDEPDVGLSGECFINALKI